jgi:hypothetical protein
MMFDVDVFSLLRTIDDSRGPLDILLESLARQSSDGL